MIRCIFIFLFAITLFFFIGCSKESDSVEHLKKSQEYVEQANKVIYKGPDFNDINEEHCKEQITLLKKALQEAMLVDIKDLNNLYVTWGDHFKDEYIEGVKLIIEGFETHDINKYLKGQNLYNSYSEWYLKTLIR